MPEEIYNAGISNIDTKRITRYSPCKIIDYCADMYAPLLIKNPSELVCYLGSHSSDEYRDMARDYARVEGVDMLPTYLQTTIDHFRTLASHTDFERETFNHIRKVESLFDRIQQQYTQQAEPVHHGRHGRLLPGYYHQLQRSCGCLPGGSRGWSARLLYGWRSQDLHRHRSQRGQCR